VQRQVRLEREFRDVETAVTSAGECAALGAGYGVGTVLHVPALGVVTELPDAPPMVYQRRLSISPRFALDGNLIVAGNVTLWGWQDPNVPPANPKNTQRWWQPDNRDPVSGEKLTGFPRVVSYSPNFDGRGLPGTDRTFFWCGWDFGPYRSEDNGATAEPLHAKAGGGTVGEMTCFAIAPTYDAAGTRTDAYCADAAGRLYRLVSEEWLEIADLGPLVEDLIVAPTWSRPGNPALFAALAGPPYVALVLDQPGNVQVIPYAAGLPAVVANGLAARPDFATKPILYLSTFGSGVWKIDFGAASPSWTQVGLDFPRLWARDVALSPDFANDRAVFAATQRGLWFCSDQPGSFWQPLTLAGSRDESDESFQYFQPAHPANPHPDHAWPWQQVMRWALPFPIVVFGDAIRYTAYDGSYAVTEARCAALEVLTVGGPGCGTLLLEAHDRDTGALINSRTVDLSLLAGTQKEERVRLDLGARKTVRVTATAVLDPGEVLVLDGIRFED
jgi:hypothetical protein